jgi:hypothetical protein
MPTQLVIENSATAKIVWGQGSHEWETTLGAHGSAPILVTQALVDTVFADIVARPETSALLGFMSATTALTAFKMRAIDVANLPEFTSSGTGGSGTGVGDSLPLSVTQCITLRTAFAGRSFRGRVYLSGWTETENDATGRMSAASSAAGVAFLDAIRAVFTAHAFELAVLSKPRAATVIPERTIAAKPGFANNVQVIQARNLKWESQRRRTGKT